MANEQNLLKGNEHTQFQSGREAVEAGRKGGIASGEAKRAKKSRKELALEIANAKITNELIKNKVKEITGLDEYDFVGEIIDELAE